MPVWDDMPPFKAVLVIEAELLQLWQWDVSRWLVSAGCRYLLAWGKDAGAWEESVDEASLEAADYEDAPEDQLVITTSHVDEDLDEVFWFAKNRAQHPLHDLRQTLILHIADAEQRDALEERYRQA